MDIATVRDRLKDLFDRGRATQALVFGSIARGTDDGRSDLDLIIIDEQDLHYLDRLGKYHRGICARLRRPVDLFVYTSQELDSIRHRPFIRKALEESVSIYER